MAPVTMLDAVEFSKIPSLQFVVPVVAADPTGYESGLIYNSTTKELKYHNGTAWVALGAAGAGAPPSGAAGGDLSGTYPNPQIAAGVIVDADVAAANKDGAAATPSLRTLGLGAAQAMPGSTKLNGIIIPDGQVNLNNQKIVNLADPVAYGDAANKLYVDNVASGLDAKASVRVATTANIANLASGAPSTVDGVALATNDRVLVKDQTTATANGIYIVNSLGTGANGVWVRASDMNVWAEFPSAYTWVEEGTVNGDTGWVCTVDQSGTLGSTNVLWVQFSGSGTFNAGAGLTKTGNTIDFVGDANLSVAPDLVSVLSAPKWTTPRSFTLTGDVTGSTPSVDGSGNISIATTVAVAGTAPKHFAGDVPAGASCVITHSLGTRDVSVTVYRTTTPWDTVLCDVQRTDTNTVTLKFATAVGAAAFRCVVQGR